MADDVKVGGLSVDVVGNLEPLKKQAKTELKKLAEEIGRDTAEAITEGMAFPITKPFPLGEPLKKQAVASLQEVMGALKKVADEKMAELREALSMGLISRSEFNRRGKEVAEAFGQGLDERVRELAMQDKVSPALLQQVDSIKQTGVDIGYQAGESLMAGLRRASELQMADAREAFARGLIDQDEFDKRGREAGQAFNNAVLAEIRKRAMDGTLTEDQFLFLTKQLKTAGIKGGDEFLAGVQHSTRIKMANARAALLRGVIDPKEYEKRGREAAEAANEAILDEIRRRAAAGTLKSKDFLALSDALKDTGAKGGKQFGQEATKGAKFALGDLNKWLAGGFVVGILMAFTGLANRIIRMFQRVATGIRDALEAGGATRTVRSSFEAVAGSRGADPTAMLSELRGALRGTATDLDLMRRATFALNAGLPATGAQMGELANIARRLGAAVGKDAAESFERLADGIAKGRSQTLQELGIMTRRNDALRAWEQQTGRNSAALSEQEKVLIHLGAVLVEGREKVAAMGDEADEAATPVQQLGTFLANLRDRTAEAVANSGPVVTMLTEIGDAAEASSDKVAGLTRHVGAYVATMVELSREHGEGPLRATGRVAGALARFGAFQLGLDEMGGVSDTYRRNLRALEIQDETSVTRLLEMQVENLEEMVRLDEKGGKAAEKQTEHLREQNREIQRRVALLTPKPTTSGTVGPTGPTEDQIKASEAATKQLTAAMREFGTAAEMGVQPLRDAPQGVQAAVRELVKASEAVRQAEEQIAAIRAGGGEVPEAAGAYLNHLRDVQAELRTLAESEIARWQQELPLIVRGVENSISRLPGYIVQVEGTVRTLDSAVADLRTQADAVASAERELLHARLAQDPARIAAAEKRLTDQRKQLRDMTAALAKGLAAAGLPAEKLNELLEEMNDLLEGAGMKAEGITEAGRDWEKLARTFEGVARGVLSIADAMGILDDRQRQALQGAIDLASGIATGGLGGTVQAIGGAIGLLQGAFGSANKMPIIESQANLIRALDRLRDAVLQDITAAEKERLTTQGGAILGGFEAMAKHLGDRFTVDKISPEALNVIRDIEQQTGTSIFKDGKIDMEAFRAAMKALEEMDLAVFGHDLTGKLDGLNWIFRSLGDEAGDAAARLTRFLSVVSDFAPDFTAQLQEIIDTQGHDAAMAWVQSLAEAFGTDGLNSELIRAIFGDNLTARDIQRIIDEALGFVGGGAGLVASGRPETRMAVNLTTTQGDELLRIGSTQLYHLAGIHSLIAQMVSAPPPVYGAMPDMSPPSPASLGLGSQTINMGGITVELSLAAQAITPGNARETGEAIGTGIGAGIDDRLRASYRGSGASGPVRVRVEAQ